MKLRMIAETAAVLALAAPVAAQTPAKAAVTAESALPGSVVSIAVEPALNDGRLVVRIAAQNRGPAPVAFGPGSVSLARPDGQKIAWIPLSQLTNDVRLAGGMDAEVTSDRPTASAYAAPQMSVRDGKVDVTGFSGASTIGADEYIRRYQTRKVKPTISRDEANSQIAALKQAILQDTTIQPRQVAAGQLVSAPLTLAKGADRTLHLRIRVGSEEHGFTIAAPAK